MDDTIVSDENECDSQPCRNGGRCIDMVYGYRCDCPSDTTGPNCERSKFNARSLSSYLVLAVFVSSIQQINESCKKLVRFNVFLYHKRAQSNKDMQQHCTVSMLFSETAMPSPNKDRNYLF